MDDLDYEPNGIDRGYFPDCTNCDMLRLENGELRRQLAAANERVGELERELAERGKDIVFYSELRDSAVGSLEKLEREREELRREWNSFRPSLVDGRLLALYGAESHHAFPIIDRILGGGK